MPIYEFVCPVHGKFERLLPRYPEREAVICLKEEPNAAGPCILDAELTTSIPAKRNPEYGIQK